MGYWVQDLSKAELDAQRREDMAYAAAIIRAATFAQPNRNGTCRITAEDIEREAEYLKNEISRE